MSIEPVRKSVTVPCSLKDAFRVFTEDVGEWWPLEKHSVAASEEREADASGAVLESREGGEMYEVMSDGSHGHWATVLEWEPPSRLVLAWQPNPNRPAPTEVEITFSELGDGRTRVDLEHRGWERLGEEGPESREDYDGGWVVTLQRFASAASSRAAQVSASFRRAAGNVPPDRRRRWIERGTTS